MKAARMIHALGTFFVGVALLIGVAVAASAVKTGGQARTLTVVGKANATLTSNESTVTGTWQNTAKTSAEARKNVEQVAGEGVQALKDMGIAENKLKTLAVTVYPEYDYSSNRVPVITGYVAKTTVQVSLTDVALAEQTLNLLTQKKASSTTGPQFGISTEAKDALQKELKVAAVADAKAQAEALAEQAGGKLGKVITINGGDFIAGGREMPIAYDAVTSLGAAEAAPSDVQPGEDELTVTVGVTYQLR